MIVQTGENFDVYVQPKNQLHPSHSLDILQKYCELVALGTLGMSDYAHPK